MPTDLTPEAIDALIKRLERMAAVDADHAARDPEVAGNPLRKQQWAVRVETLHKAAIALRAAPVAMRERAVFQDRVKPWMNACFGEAISNDRLERGDRLLEEVLELLQSGDYPPERIAALVSYVWNRPKGEPAQEVGGVMVTLAAYCLAHDLDMHDAAETELARIWTKVEKIRAKQAAKPTGSALPVALPLDAPAPAVDPVAEAARVLPPCSQRLCGLAPVATLCTAKAGEPCQHPLAQETRHEG